MLEVSLRKAGFSVTPAVSVADALEKLEASPPDLIICETKFPSEQDGFELRRRLRNRAEWAEIPFIFLTAETAIENKIKGLELGVDDYLTKPIYIKEIVTRINILLQKKQRQFLDLRKDGTRFAGRVADMPVVDVIQTIEVSRKSGVIQFTGPGNRQAAIYFRDGKVIDAEAGTLQGEDAVYRLLTWNEGEFEVEFRTVRRREVIETSSQGLLMEGMRRLDEWSRLLEQLPPLTHRFEIDAAELALRLGDVPDDNNRILRLFDSKRTLLEVIDASDFGDLECLQAISRLYFEGMLVDLDPGVRTERVTGKPMPLVQVEDSLSGPHSQPHVDAPAAKTPMQAAASSGPINLAGLEARAADEPTTAAAPDSAVPDATSEPVMSPSELAADMGRRSRRDSSQQIADSDVVAEEEVHGPLSGNYRPSTLRLIDEAVAAAQLIEPSLFTDDELAAAGVKRASAEQVAAARQDIAAASPLSTANGASGATSANGANGAPSATGANGSSNGRARGKTLPPPLPTRPAAKVSPKEIENAPMLDSSLLTSGEHKIPSEEDLANAPLLDSALLTSGEHKIPEQLRLTATMNVVEIEAEDYSGVPTIIEAEKDNVPDASDDKRPREGHGASIANADAGAAARMIGSEGRDRAEAHGELKPADGSAGETLHTQRELITIMPRRKPPAPIDEEVSTLDAKDKAQKAVAAAAAAKAKAEAEAKDEEITAVERVENLPPPDETVTTSSPKPAVEPPARPAPRAARVSVAGGTVAPERGPGRGAQVLIALASILAGALVYSQCRKHGTTKQPVAVEQQDAAMVVTAPEPDAAPQYNSFGASTDAAVVASTDRPDAGTHHRDAAVAVTKPDAAQVAMTPVDAAVPVARPDAAQVVVAPAGDAGTGPAPVDKGKEAAALTKEARDALAEGEAQKALDLFDQALKLKKDKRTYVDRGRALHNLGRTDEALASIDEAIAMSEGYLPAWEQKGLILWSAQKYDQARPVLEKYLELAPDGPRAEQFRKMLDEPK